MKKKILIFLLFFILIILISFSFFLEKKENVQISSKPKEKFRIGKTIFYSGANAISNTTSFQNPEWNLSVFQYTDIAIYLNRVNSDNYITDIILENVDTENEFAKVYYLNPKEFGNNTLREDNLIENSLEYTVINSENKDNEQNYNIPIFFQDCSNPITLRIVTLLSNNYQVPNDQTLEYSGKLISDLGLETNDLNKSISFDLKIKTRQSDENMKVNLPIVYEENGKSILDGDIKIERK